MMSAHTVRFYFDYGSPYSYIASHRSEEIASRRARNCSGCPSYWAEYSRPAKFNRRKYLFEDVRDLSVFYGIPYKERTEFLFKPVPALRAPWPYPGALSAPEQ